MTPLVSVIIPVYNVEKYLQRCVDSVSSQTYTNIEIILIDDGSSDCCPEICDDLAKKDSRIVVIHKSNGGPSTARNVGLDSAKGEYICFVDSDDWIANDTIEYLLSLFQKYSVDMVEAGMYCTSKFIPNLVSKEKKEVLRGKDILQDYLRTTTTDGISYSVCNCMFPAPLLRDFRFRNGYNNEDLDFKYKVLNQCETILKSSKVQYFYYQGKESITTSGFRMKDFDLDIASDILVDLTKEETFGSIRYLAQVKRARCAFSHLCRIAYYGIADKSVNKKDMVNHLVIEHRKNVVTLLKSPMARSRKTLVLMFAVNYRIAEAAIHLYQRLRNLFDPGPIG